MHENKMMQKIQRYEQDCDCTHTVLCEIQIKLFHHFNKEKLHLNLTQTGSLA